MLSTKKKKKRHSIEEKLKESGTSGTRISTGRKDHSR